MIINRNKGGISAWLTLSLGLVIGLWSCDRPENNIDSEIKIPVSVNTVKPESIEMFVETTGTVYATEEVYLKSNLSGNYYLMKNPSTGKPFALGDKVRKGQVIIKLEDKEFENNAQITSKKLNLEVSKNNFDKQKSLFDKGGVTLRELKNAEIEYINAKYSYENAAIQLSKTLIKSPFDGSIVELPHHTRGVKVEQGAEMVKLMNYQKLLLDVKLPEKNLNEISLGQMVRVMNYTVSKDTLTGNINQISPVINPDSRTFQSTLQIDNKNESIRPGMFVKAEILVQKKDSTIVVPKDIILSKQNGKVVFVVENGIALEKIISTGLENANNIEVTQGIKLNDRLVITGYETLRNKSQVNVIR